MPSYRIVTVGAPKQRKAYGGAVQSNAVAYAPIQVQPPLGAFGGDEQTWGAPNRLVLGADPQMANYLPSEQIPSRWAAPVIANQRYTTLTNPSQSPLLRRINRDEHVPVPALQRQTASSAFISAVVEGGTASNSRARPPRGMVTPTPQVRPTFRMYGGGTT